MVIYIFFGWGRKGTGKHKSDQKDVHERNINIARIARREDG